MTDPLRTDATDPFSEGRAYQQLLLAALGDDEPAAAAEEAAERVRRLIDEAGADLRTRPEPREWSVLLCLAHIADAELVMAGRYRWVIAHDEPELPGYDQDLWVDNLHSDADDPEALLAQFRDLRAGNIALWQRATPEQRARVGLHRERGRESLDLMFRMLAGHDRVHLAQAERALAAVRRSKAP